MLFIIPEIGREDVKIWRIRVGTGVFKSALHGDAVDLGQITLEVWFAKILDDAPGCSIWYAWLGTGWTMPSFRPVHVIVDDKSATAEQSPVFDVESPLHAGLVQSISHCGVICRFCGALAFACPDWPRRKNRAGEKSLEINLMLQQPDQHLSSLRIALLFA